MNSLYRRPVHVLLYSYLVYIGYLYEFIWSLFISIIMANLSETEQQKLSKFVEYSLLLILKGFDEMDLKQRLELIKLFGSVIDIYVNRLLYRISDLEKRIEILENKNKKKDFFSEFAGVRF